jgi:hypothetical protein
VADTQQLVDRSKCYLCLGISLDEGIELALLQSIAQNGSGPVAASERITEASDVRITEAGDIRIVQ